MLGTPYSPFSTMKNYSGRADEKSVQLWTMPPFRFTLWASYCAKFSRAVAGGAPFDTVMAKSFARTKVCLWLIVWAGAHPRSAN